MLSQKAENLLQYGKTLAPSLSILSTTLEYKPKSESIHIRFLNFGGINNVCFSKLSRTISPDVKSSRLGRPGVDV